ncbi:hypothetical protein K450DRAFT_252150 [Umbelopsis ramanniana AG]|uniref:Aminotransferase class V domain-containing protein n=1 Tax=Umbelopsis ramanniana AG TaxID=1314678 RepID=A0AAD5HAW1_UMBRA|nr:uncharacterized protein K450DRAFT_252150 [Umbelopsis ramanniana AG]KAI8577367.1 hypothetical protein K450DRAFT_252150 [Umbelopsis ramanniana AG]
MAPSSNHHAKKQFGHSLRADFLIADDYTLMNHGSYGTYPAVVRTALRQYQDRAENCIDTWFRRDMYTEVQKAKEKLATLIHCHADDLAFIANASTGINSVARSLPFQSGDKILQLSTIFAATGATMRFVRDTRGVELIILDPTYPISDDDLVAMIEEAILKEETKVGVTGGKIKMAVLDTISSTPGVRVPFERIIKLLRKHNILSLVDGAHGIGQIPLNLHETDPDFFISNCHKWLYTVRGSSILYVAKRNQRYIHPAITSEYYKDHSDLSDMSETFHKEFSWQGTQDFSGFLTTFAALEYRESLGGEEKIQEYCGNLARRGGELVAKILGTEVMENEEKTLTAMMVNVRLPLVAHENDGYYMERFLEEGAFKRKCFAPGYKYKGTWYTRLSAQVYMEESDFEKAAHVLKDICEQLEQERLEGQKK